MKPRKNGTEMKRNKKEHKHCHDKSKDPKGHNCGEQKTRKTKKVIQASRKKLWRCRFMNSFLLLLLWCCVNLSVSMIRLQPRKNHSEVQKQNKLWAANDQKEVKGKASFPLPLQRGAPSFSCLLSSFPSFIEFCALLSVTESKPKSLYLHIEHYDRHRDEQSRRNFVIPFPCIELLSPRVLTRRRVWNSHTFLLTHIIFWIPLSHFACFIVFSPLLSAVSQ